MEILTYHQPPSPYDRMFYTGDPTTTLVGSINPFYARPLKPRLVSEWLRCAARRWPGAIGPRIEDIEWVTAQYDGEIRSVDDGISAAVPGTHIFSHGYWLTSGDDWGKGKCGIKVLQCMAAVLPVVANPFGVHLQMIEHDKSGFLADAPENWIRAVVTLRKNPVLAKQMGARGKDIVREK